jgi:hypothetical protein
MIFFQRNPHNLMMCSAFPTFCIVCPSNGESSACIKSALLLAGNLFMERMFQLHLDATHTTLDYSPGLLRGYLDFLE